MDLHQIKSGYDIDEHTHRFGVWTAARAASKSRLKNSEVETLIEEVNLREGVEYLRNHPSLTDQVYRDWIKGMGTSLMNRVENGMVTNFKKEQFSFGLSAKIISIYIKTVEVLPTGGQSTLSKVAYPPIDGILLRRFNKKHNIKVIKTWSKFCWDEYIGVIDVLMLEYPNIPMWQIEALWKVQ